MSREQLLRRRIRWLTGVFIVGLFLSGVTAIPLGPEVNWLAEHFGAADKSSVVAGWLERVQEALGQTQVHYPFFFMAQTGWRSGIS